MKPKLTLIGFACIPLGALISIAFNLPWLGAPMIFAGAFLFTSFYDTAVFVDYCTFENCQYVITIRIRHYVIPLIFLGRINFIYKTSYYKVVSDTLEMDDISADNNSEISAAEYKQMLINQRQQYKNGLAPKEIVADICSPDMVCFKQRKFKYVLCLILTLLSLTPLSLGDPSAFFLVVLFGGLLGWLLVIRKAEYEEAKIKKATYDRYFPQ